MKNLSNRDVRRIKTAVFLASLLPCARLFASWVTDGLGPDPVAVLTRTTGIWTLNFLFITLAVSPLRKLTGWNWLVRLRRTVALYSFFYACLHFAVYLVFDQFFDWPAIGTDVMRRPYITVGFLSFVLLAPLALTSTDGMMRRLGGRRWQQLHLLVYPIAIGAVLHYFWLVKRDITEPGLYAIVLCLLLCVRMATRPRSRTAAVSARRLPETAPIGGGMGSATARHSRK